MRPSTPPTSPADVSFEEFTQARWSALFRSAYLLTGTAHEAEDLLQDALTKVFTNWERVARADSPEAYARKTLLNTFLDAKRRKSRRDAKDRLFRVREEPSHDRDPSARLDLWGLLATLAPQQRAVLVLRYYEDLPEEQIAAVLGISPGTVKSHAAAAMRSLRAARNTIHHNEHPGAHHD